MSKVREIIEAANAAHGRLDDLCSEFARVQVALEAASRLPPDAPDEKHATAVELEAQRDDLIVKLIEAWKANVEATRNYETHVEPLIGGKSQ